MLRPPGVELDHPRELPTIYVIQGYTGQIDMWMGRKAFEPTFIERMDAMLACDECPDAIVVMVDCWTSYGGSQFLDSTGTGPYQSYLCDEIVPFIDERYPTAADRDHRGITGKSSGGYGAMVVPMMRPDVFSALASHAGDALFEISMTPGIASAVRTLRDHYESSYDVFFERLPDEDPFDYERHNPIEMYGYAACLLAGPRAARQGAAAVRPVQRPADRRRLAAVARARPGRHGPEATPTPCDRCGGSTSTPARATSTASTSAPRPSRTSCTALGVDHTLDLFDGAHGGLTYRYPASDQGTGPGAGVR